jgi:hypothetical protein
VSKLFLYFLIVSALSFESLYAQSIESGETDLEKKIEKIEKLNKSKWVKFYSYVPEKTEYNFELGSMWEVKNMYWLGGSMGFHIGKCMFSESQSCQQFADFTGGASGRSGFTNGLLMSSLRWQFTDLKDSFVPHARVLLGAINHRDEERDRTVFAYGIGYGITAAIHERLDLKLELRGGGGDRLWSQGFISFSLKFDRFVDYFAKKLESMGMAGRIVKGTAEITGKIIQGTVETTGKVIQGTMQTTSDVIEVGGKKAKDILDSSEEKKETPKP